MSGQKRRVIATVLITGTVVLQLLLFKVQVIWFPMVVVPILYIVGLIGSWLFRKAWAVVLVHAPIAAWFVWTLVAIMIDLYKGLHFDGG